MNTSKMLAVVGGLAVALAGLYAVNRVMNSSLSASTRGTTKVGTAGQAQNSITTVTPIKTSQVAVAAPQSTLELIGNALKRVRGGLSSVLPVTTDRLARQKNPVSARAAATAPLRPEYKQSAYATFRPGDL